jgi:DNA-binding NarL/FixJ family response regulator
MQQITTVVVDDHPAILDAVSRLLAAEGVHVLAACGSAEAALTEIVRLLPQTALVDVQMPGMGGLELVRQASQAAPGTAILVYTGFADPSLLADAMDAGASGLVCKDAPLRDLGRALRVAASGGTFVDASLAGSMLRSPVQGGLSLRELEVLRLLAEGRSNEAMGRELFLSAETVRTYVRRAKNKLGAETRTQAVAIALRESLIT